MSDGVSDGSPDVDNPHALVRQGEETGGFGFGEVLVHAFECGIFGLVNVDAKLKSRRTGVSMVHSNREE